MGHRQQMSDKQRLEFDTMRYKRMLEARRGHNHSYMSDVLYEDLNKKGYERYLFNEELKKYVAHEEEAIKIRDELRNTGHFARIISSANKLRIREYEVWFKKKKK